MGGNRKHGFMRGNGNGRSKAKPDWHCHGCNKSHKALTPRNLALDKKDYCNRTYYKMMNER